MNLFVISLKDSKDISALLIQFLFLYVRTIASAFAVFSLSLSRCLSASASLPFQLSSQSEKIFIPHSVYGKMSIHQSILKDQPQNCLGWLQCSHQITPVTIIDSIVAASTKANADNAVFAHNISSIGYHTRRSLEVLPESQG